MALEGLKLICDAKLKKNGQPYAENIVTLRSLYVCYSFQDKIW